MKRFTALMLVFTAILCFTACKKENTSESTLLETPDFTYTESSNPTNFVNIEMTDGNIMIVELYPEKAPITVENFKNLVSQKYYDGLVFHRIINRFMIQGGDGKNVPSIKGEFSSNGVENDIKHERGVISMARTNVPDSASSQFFICHTTEGCKHLDGDYAAFGKMIFGFKTLDKLAAVETGYGNAPIKEQKMKSIRFIVIDSETTTSSITESSAVSTASNTN